MEEPLLPVVGVSRRSKWGSVIDTLLEPCVEIPLQHPDSCLASEDLKPVPVKERTFSVWDMASLWVGLTISIPVYYLAGSLVDMGMVWWEGVLTIVVANSITAFPLILIAHAGTKYGVPFPVVSRASFGLRGVHIPTLSRALVACIWFGIETWIGGQATFTLVDTLTHGSLSSPTHYPVIPWLGISTPELVFFAFFWLLQLAIIWNGIESIRELEKYAAPVLIALSVALLAWAYIEAGGFGPMLSIPSQFSKGGAKEGQFWQVFSPAFTANVGFWSSLSLSISDISRYTKTQKDQILGQVGLPIFMGAYTFVGLAVTSATQMMYGEVISSLIKSMAEIGRVLYTLLAFFGITKSYKVIYGEVISNSIKLMAKIGGVFPTLLAFLGITLATLTTNVAANIVSPANALSSLNPRVFSFRRGAIITALLGALSQPWHYLHSSKSFVNTWLVGYSSVVGPFTGIFLTDYYILHHRYLDITELYSGRHSGPYWYLGGFNINAIMALLIGILPSLPGFLYTVGILKEAPTFFQIIYNNAWFSGFFLAGFAYWLSCVLLSVWRVGRNHRN